MHLNVHGHHVDGGRLLLPHTKYGPGGDLPTDGNGGTIVRLVGRKVILMKLIEIHKKYYLNQVAL